jgi:hypothetical protein
MRCRLERQLLLMECKVLRLNMYWKRVWLATLGAIALSACSSEKRELVRVASPDHATTAVVMQDIGGGAAISSVYSLYLSDGHDALNDSILQATYRGGISLAWEGSSKLLVEYDSECYIKKFSNKWWSKPAIQKAQAATVEIVLIQRRETRSIQQP